MPRFALNLTLAYPDLPVAEKCRAAVADGLQDVEILLPYDLPGRDLAALLRSLNLRLALINTPVPDWAQGGRGTAALPGQGARFRAEFAQALDYAAALNVPILHVMSGLANGPEAARTFATNLSWAADLAAMRLPGLTLTVEPINPHDMPGYFMAGFDQAATLLDSLNRPNLALQFDAYHAHRITGDALATWDTHGHRAAHIQIAAAEGRHEPLPGGAIDFAALFTRIDAGGYTGVVSGEYHPRGAVADGLHWMRAP